MAEADFAPKTISKTNAQVVKMVVGSAIGDDGESLPAEVETTSSFDLPEWPASELQPSPRKKSKMVLRLMASSRVLYALLPHKALESAKHSPWKLRHFRDGSLRSGRASGMDVTVSKDQERD